MFLMMTVFPGFAGQTLIEDVLPKITEVEKPVEQKKLQALIEADGGIKTDNIDRVVKAGA